ncbi:hypothetical protein AVEN_59487-1 [Araneus ventricosus]|uniref:Uncharacterized protein n=1 Tax=Araneus ventricosus TaxID=182803 RepID=A0A4Y2TVZ8_ARAVE|nr:hypothetical protein AVEN_59487-1 [Araneus ventricosus]
MARAVPTDQEASTKNEELVRAWISRYGVPMILFGSRLQSQFGVMRLPGRQSLKKRSSRTVLESHFPAIQVLCGWKRVSKGEAWSDLSDILLL